MSNPNKKMVMPPKLTISEWADEYGVLVGDGASGRWHTYNYQRAMMDAFCQLEARNAALREQLSEIRQGLKIATAAAFKIHPDDLQA